MQISTSSRKAQPPLLPRKAKGFRRDGVGLRIAKPATAITLLGDYGAGAFPRIEAAAGGSAIGIVSARTSDELCALTDDQHSH
jgi:hypothetical protein